VDVLPSREFCLDEAGLVDFSGPGADLSHNAAATGATGGSPGRRREVNVEDLLPLIRASLERGMLAAEVPLTGVVEEEELDGKVVPVRHSEPRPSMIVANLWTSEKEAATLSRNLEQAHIVEAHYRQLCQKQKLRSSPAACRALQAIGLGEAELPKDIASLGYLGNRGAQALFLALASCPQREDTGDGTTQGAFAVFEELRRLDLAGQGIANEAAFALAELVPRCPKLAHIDLSRNNVSEKAAHRLLQAVEAHPSIMEVKLEGNPVPSWLRVRLNTMLATRRPQV